MHTAVFLLLWRQHPEIATGRETAEIQPKLRLSTALIVDLSRRAEARLEHQWI